MVGKAPLAGSGITRLALELADLPGHPARLIARRHKSEVHDWLAGMLQKAARSARRERRASCSC